MDQTTVQLLDQARARLARHPQEALGREKSSRWRGTRIVPAGSAWHVGALLLADDRTLATAEVLRAAEPARRGYVAESARARAERRAQAWRGGFKDGQTVHVGWIELDVTAVDAGGTSGPLALLGDVPGIAWRPGGNYMPLAAYLEERLGLLGL